MVNIDKALVDPALVFKAPEEVVADNELSREQKRNFAALGIRCEGVASR